MKIDALKLGVAAGISTSLVFAFIGTMIRTWPTETLRFISATHFFPKLDLLAPYINVNPTDILLGAISHAFFSFFFFWLIGSIYNKLQ